MVKKQNPRTIVADQVYNGADIEELSVYNLYPILVKTSVHVNSKILKEYYHNFSNSNNTSYYFLDVFHFLGKAGGTNIILSGSDIRKIDYSKLLINTNLGLEDNNEISTNLVLYTEEGKLLLTDILSNLMEEELKMNKDKVYKKTK